MSKKALLDELDNLKADYARIQSDMDKLEYVKGRVSSAEEQLIRLDRQSKRFYYYSPDPLLERVFSIFA